MCDSSTGNTAEAAYLRSRLTLLPRLAAPKNSTWLFRTPEVSQADYVAQTVTFNGWDAAGNYADALSFSFIADNVAPVIDVKTRVATVTLGDPTEVLGGTVSDGGPLTAVQIEVHAPDGAVSLVNAARSGNNWWYQSLATTVGLHTLWVIATDQAGNRSAAGPYGLEVTCLAAVPMLTSLLVEPAEGVPGAVTISARLDDTGSDLPAGMPLGFYANGVPVATATAPAVAAGQGLMLTATWPDVHGGAFDLRVAPNAPDAEGSRLPLCTAPESLSRTVAAQDLALRTGWNLVSSPVNPQNPDITVVQRPISGAYATIQSFDQGALSYYPTLPPQMNTLKTWDALHGYWIRVTALPADPETLEAARLLVVGQAVPDTTPLALDVGWNLVSYLPQTTLPVTMALASIAGSYTAVQGFDGGALSFYPDLEPEMNSLLTLQSGKGYWIRTVQAVTLTYPSAATGGGVTQTKISPSSQDTPQRVRVGEFEQEALIRRAERDASVTPTSVWVDFYGEAVLADGIPLSPGTVIRALDPQGVVCGATVVRVEGRYGYLPCYGDDPDTPGDEGALVGDTITLQAMADDQAQVVGTGLWTARGDRQKAVTGAPLPADETPTPSPTPETLPTETPTPSPMPETSIPRIWLPIITRAGPE